MSSDLFPTIANQSWIDGQTSADIEPATGDQIAEMIYVGAVGVGTLLDTARPGASF